MNARSTLHRVIGAEPLWRAWRRLSLGPRVVVLMYHEVLDDSAEVDAWTVVRASDFRRQMAYLAEHHRVVSLEAALRSMREPDACPDRLVVVTLDDAYSGSLAVVLPIVEALGVPIAIFVPTAAVETGALYWYDRVIIACQRAAEAEVDVDLAPVGLRRHHRFPRGERGERRWTHVQALLTDLKRLPPEEREGAVERVLPQLGWRVDAHPGREAPLRPLTVRELQVLAASPLVTIGAHSHCHSILVQLPDEGIRATVETSRRLLERWTGRSPMYFAYPNGDYDHRVVDALERSGFQCGLTTASRPWGVDDSVFGIPRVGVGRYEPLATFRAKASGSPI